MATYEVILERATHFRITAKEIQILLLVAEGKALRIAAAELQISPSTVRSHIASLRRKLDAADRAQLMLRALEEGVLANVQDDRDKRQNPDL